jgi:hypothetical protein
MSPWTSLFWLITAFLGLLFLNRWINAHVQGVAFILTNSKVTAIWLYFFLFLPGILIHEVSHYLAAVLLGVRVDRFSLWPKVRGRGEVVLGSVQVRGADPIRHSLVGAAPLLVGSLAVLLIGRLLKFDTLGLVLTSGNLEYLLNTLGESLSTPDFWLWLYFLFAISNAMLPSPADRVYWTPVLLFLGVIIVLGVGLDLLPTIPGAIQEYTFNFVTLMASAFAIAVAVDLFFALFIFLLETTLNITTKRKIQY